MCKVVTTVPASRFERFGVPFPSDWQIVYLDYPASDDVLIEACKNADFLFVGSVHVVSANVIAHCPSLRMIHVEGVAYDKVDASAAAQAGVPVCNNRASNNSAVAEHTVGLMIAALRRIPLGNTELRCRDYAQVQTQFRQEGIHEMSSQHVGLVGIGAIGQEVARMLAPFGCRVSYYDAFRPKPEREKELNVTYLSLEDLLGECDIISLHVPVLPDTVGMINRQTLSLMKKNALLVNTSRGEIVDQDALIDALKTGAIFGAALDTFTPEPAPLDHPLLTLPKEAADRLILSPHIGGTTVEAFTRMLQWAIASMKAVLAGNMPNNIVNGVNRLKQG